MAVLSLRVNDENYYYLMPTPATFFWNPAYHKFGPTGQFKGAPRATETKFT